MKRPIRKLPNSIVEHGYLKIPEWLIYYLKPNSLSVLRMIMKSRKLDGRTLYSDITNSQLAEACGISLSYVNKIIIRLSERKYIRRWKYFESNDKSRRKIYIKNLKSLMHQKTEGKSFIEFLESNRFQNQKRVEWKNINCSNWIGWIPMPNEISNAYEMKVIGVLLGQFLRGSEEIRLSNRQIGLMCKIDRETVAVCINNLQGRRLISVHKPNNRSRIIKLN